MDHGRTCFAFAAGVAMVCGHAAKLTGDVVVALNSVQDNLTGASGAGILGDPKSGQVAIRLQFQLLF